MTVTSGSEYKCGKMGDVHCDLAEAFIKDFKLFIQYKSHQLVECTLHCLSSYH